jgi:FkbM family methyltransferase
MSLAAANDYDVYRTDEHILVGILRPGDTVVDVGANVGFLSLMAGRLVGDQGRVYALEPHPSTFRYLVRNIRLNSLSNVVPLKVAVGESRGTVRFTDDEHDDINRIDDEGAINVRLIDLDTLFALDDRRIRLLKIDVEGAELHAIRGAIRMLRRVDYVYIEIAEANCRKFGYSASQILDELSRLQFRLFAVHKDGRIEEASASYTADKWWNCLAVAGGTQDRQ